MEARCENPRAREALIEHWYVNVKSTNWDDVEGHPALDIPA